MINTDRHVILCVVISSISIAAAPMIIHTFYVITATALHVHVVCRRSTCLVLVGLMFVSTVTSRCASSPPSRHGVPRLHRHVTVCLVRMSTLQLHSFRLDVQCATLIERILRLYSSSSRVFYCNRSVNICFN